MDLNDWFFLEGWDGEPPEEMKPWLEHLALKPGWYKLVNGKIVRCESIDEAMCAFASDRRVDYTDIGPDCHVSTVFLGLDHNYNGPDHPPILFETMVFGGDWDGRTYRYTNMGEAKRGHWEIVTALREGREPVIEIGERGFMDWFFEQLKKAENEEAPEDQDDNNE